MPTVDRRLERGARRGRRALAMLGEEFRIKRLTVGLSQRQVAAAASIGRSTYTHIENGSFGSLSVLTSSKIAAVLGLDLSVRTYPGDNPLRDAAQARRLARVQAVVNAPLAWQTEAALPSNPQRPYEQRAWDARVTGAGRRTTMEFEMRITDAQAMERRIQLKRRDDPPDNFVLLVADTHSNRRVLRENPELFPDLPRMTFGQLARFLRAGHHPPDALVLI